MYYIMQNHIQLKEEKLIVLKNIFIDNVFPYVDTRNDIITFVTVVGEFRVYLYFLLQY